VSLRDAKQAEELRLILRGNRFPSGIHGSGKSAVRVWRRRHRIHYKPYMTVVLSRVRVR
jgi:hypothetical protein